MTKTVMGMSLKDKFSSEEKESDEYLSLNLDGSVLGEFIKHRLENNRDAKIIITSKSASTGLGKSTLAILIAEWIHEKYHEEKWDAEKYGHINVNDYIQQYLDSKPQTALLLDEIEAGADNRRSMSSENVNLSKAWATLRMRNVVTLATLPSTLMLDSRMMPLADIWINVMRRGVAVAYFIWINDFTHEIKTVAAKHPKTGQKEMITWKAIDDNDNFKYMSKLKNTDVFGDSDKTFDYSEVQSKKEEAKREKRNDIIKTLYKNTDMSQGDIGHLLDMTQQQVSQICRTLN